MKRTNYDMKLLNTAATLTRNGARQTEDAMFDSTNSPGLIHVKLLQAAHTHNLL